MNFFYFCGMLMICLTLLIQNVSCLLTTHFYFILKLTRRFYKRICFNWREVKDQLLFVQSTIKNFDSHPYLVIELQSSLKWGTHYDKITSKASIIVFMLKYADTKTRNIAYFFVRPILEYGCLVRAPFINIKIFEKFKIQP